MQDGTQKSSGSFGQDSARSAMKDLDSIFGLNLNINIISVKITLKGWYLGLVVIYIPPKLLSEQYFPFRHSYGGNRSI